MWRPAKKLDNKFIGLFETIDTKGKLAYTLRLSKQYSHYHPTFHVFLLEPYHQRDSEQTPNPEPIVEDDSEFWEVKAILDCYEFVDGTKWLVKWKDFPSYEN